MTAHNDSSPDLLTQAGGMDGLRAVLDTFYEAVFKDTMIGYLFWNSDKAHLIEKQAEMVARMLGASHITYTGKSLRAAHAKHQILGGHFARRTVLLQQAWEVHQLPQEVRDAWLKRTESLRSLVTADASTSCAHKQVEAFLS